MGIYVYTLRKRTVNVHHDGPDGEHKTPANCLSFAYKQWLSFAYDSATKRRRDFIRDNAARNAERAFTETPHALVAMVDADDKPRDGDPVYADLQRPVWYDTDAVPARLVGFLQKRRGRWYLVDATPWECRNFREGARWVRQVAVDGKAVEEHVRQPESGVADYDRAARYEMPGRRYPQIVDPREQVEIQVVW